MFPAEPIPDTIGTYKIVRRLPGGGAADLYLAKAQGPMGFERECELKLMPDTSEGDASYAEELAREAAICAKLNNPAVVRVFDFFEHQGKLVLALEHVEGVTLADLLQHMADEREGKLGDAAIYFIGARIAGALGDAHAAKDERGEPTPIVHRNISPDTVLISVEGDVRLTGFGVGKILGRTPDTAIGRIKGTPGYMAPEQARGEPVTTKADVYGLGLLLWSLLAGRRPPMDGTWPRRITGIRNDLPREVAALIDASLDHFPGTRKITAREIEQWLSKAAPATKGRNELRQAVVAYRAATKDVDPPPPSSRRRIASVAPYKGVSFGPPGAAKGHGTSRPAALEPGKRPSTSAFAAVRANDMHEEPRTRTERPRTEVPSRTPTSAGMGKLVLDLPPPPPASERPPSEYAAASSVGDSPAPARVRFGTAPPGLPPPPPAPTFGLPPVNDAQAAPAPTGLLAPVLPLAPTPAPAPVEAPTSIRFGPPPFALGETPKPPGASPAPPPVAVPRSEMETLAGPVVPAPPIFVPQVLPLALPDPPARRPPLPSLLTTGPGRRSLSAFGAIVVSAITATVVVSVALSFRRDRGGSSSAASASASAPPPPVAPPPTASASAAAPPPKASASADPSALPLGFGYLTILSPAEANVYLSGKLLGPVNKALRVRCGRWFIRLAAPEEGRYPEWVTPGETVLVPCQEAVRIEMNPRRF